MSVKMPNYKALLSASAAQMQLSNAPPWGAEAPHLDDVAACSSKWVAGHAVRPQRRHCSPGRASHNIPDGAGSGRFVHGF